MSIESSLKKLVSVAEGEVGYAAGSNQDNKYGKAFGQNNVDWCAWFVAWCADQAGILTSKSSAECPYMPVEGYVPDVYKWYKASRRNLIPILDDEDSANRPQAGDVVIIDTKGGEDGKNHIGIICEVNGTTVKVIEGNDYDSKTGKQVVKKLTYKNRVCGQQYISYLCSNHVSY